MNGMRSRTVLEDSGWGLRDSSDAEIKYDGSRCFFLRGDTVMRFEKKPTYGGSYSEITEEVMLTWRARWNVLQRRNPRLTFRELVRCNCTPISMYESYLKIDRVLINRDLLLLAGRNIDKKSRWSLAACNLSVRGAIRLGGTRIFSWHAKQRCKGSISIK